MNFSRRLLVPSLLWAMTLCFFFASVLSTMAATASVRRGSAVSKVLRYETIFLPPRIHRELPITRIQGLSGFHPTSSWQNPGLTIGAHELKTDFDLSGSQMPGGAKVKVWLETLNVVFRYTGLDVYVANDYAEGSCESRQITKHEMDHVAVHRRVYAKHQAILKRALLSMDLPTRARPKTYPSLSAAQKDLSKRLRAVTEGQYGRFKAELSAKNDRLDTPANYKAIQRRCKDWK